MSKEHNPGTTLSARRAWALFESSPAKQLVLDPRELRIVAASDAYLEATMTRRGDIVGQPLFEVFPDDPKDDQPSVVSAARASLERVVTTGRPHTIERQRYPIRVGPAEDQSFELRYWRIVNTPLLDADGRVEHLIHHVEDITRQVMAEEQAREASALQRIAGHAARLGGWRVTLDPPGVVWSAETAAIHGEPEGTSPSLDQAIGYYVPEHRERIRRALETCADDGTPFDELLQLVTAHGNRIQVRAIGEPEWADDGTVRAVRGAFQDVSELVVAKTRSQRLARRLHQALEHMSDAFFTLDENWCFGFVNGEMTRIVGKPQDQLLGEPIWQCFPEAENSVFHHHFRHALDTGEPASFVAYYPPLDRWLSVKAYPLPEGLAVYFQDVTRERAEQEELQLLRTAVSRLNDIVIITAAEPIEAPDGPRILYVNEAFERHTGYSRDEVIGRTPRLLQGPETSRGELDRVRRALQDRQPVRAEILNYTRNGQALWLEIDIVPIADSAGRYTRWVAVERDVTGRRRTEELIRRNDERFGLLARATNDVIWDWDITRNHVWRNESLQTNFGYDPSAIDPTPDFWTGRLHAEDRARVLHALRAALAGTASRWEDEYRFVRSDGGVATVIERGFIVRDEAGRATRMLGSTTDVSERRDLEERIRQSQKLEALGQLTGGVAHDFNNLLTVILGNAEVLSDRLAGHEDLHGLVQLTVAAAERGSELTSRLLAFARRQPLQPQSVVLDRLIDSLEPLLRRTLPEHIQLAVEPSRELWCAEVDPGQLEVALLNLVVNARDAMPDGGRLTIRLSNASFEANHAREDSEDCSGEYVCIAVSDTGGGMPEDVVAQAFEPFFTTKAAGRGSGLGLSMVYGFARQSGGHVSIDSAPGKSTTVTLYFPRVNGRSDTESQSASEPELVGGSEHILVAEDDDLVRDNLTAQLHSLGYTVTSVASGPEALDALRELPHIDLLLTDILMPGGMNGRELAEAAARLRPGLPVLFSSGYAEDAIVHDGRLDAGVQLLSKPYHRRELAASVRSALDK
ncbi:PAS domain-containing protein [Spiribacter halobius]|uniref:PAS domain-containing protein n=1 Tax=Sediminicurvatus halobius TaxID=2182432 RepID=UPI0018EE60FB|nr:PAS domain-containing protein [Spiribacter halobius]UEX76756.1 PAS domain-containing protein [Spiribacter halobius]